MPAVTVGQGRLRVTAVPLCGMVETVTERDKEGVFRGAWEITSTELWDKDALDLVAQAQIRFDARHGELAMIAVRGWLDCRYLERDGRPAVEFSWEGEDEGDQRCGRGWAALKPDGTLQGRLFFHMGDDSAFSAVRTQAENKRSGLTGRRRPAVR